MDRVMVAESRGLTPELLGTLENKSTRQFTVSIPSWTLRALLDAAKENAELRAELDEEVAR